MTTLFFGVICILFHELSLKCYLYTANDFLALARKILH